MQVTEPCKNHMKMLKTLMQHNGKFSIKLKLIKLIIHVNRLEYTLIFHRNKKVVFQIFCRNQYK